MNAITSTAASGRTPMRSIQSPIHTGTAMQKAMAMRQSQRRSSHRGTGMRTLIVLLLTVLGAPFAALAQASGEFAPIVNLREVGSPPAVPRLVVAVVIDAVNSAAGRASSHVFKEGRETLAPTLAYVNAPAAVVLIALCFFVVATRFHGGPRSVLTRGWDALAASPRFAVRFVSSRSLVVAEAAAAFHQLAAEVGAGDSRRNAAITAAAPHGVRADALTARRAPYNKQSAESLPSQFDYAHMVNYIRKCAVLVVALAMPSQALAQQYTISPPPYLLAQNNAGAIINAACVWTYVAGTTTPATTYSDSAGTPNSNPIRSDSAGRFTAFLSPGNSYKFVYESACTPPAHGTTLRTADNISAMPPSGVNVDITGTAGETISAGSAVYISDGSGGNTLGSWYNASSSNTYSSTAATIVGFAASAVTSGNAGSFRISGRVTGLSSVSPGSSYYIAASAGTITATAPGAARLVGIADSATTLVVAPNPKVTTTSPLGIAEGRLTATTAVPVTTADVSGATSIFYTPYKGNRIALYDGTATWNVRTFTEITVSLSGCTASKPYDVFLYDNASVVTEEHLVWTSDTARATALVTQDGVLVKSGATTRRYVGSFYCNSSGGQTDDTILKRYIANYYNSVTKHLRVQEPADSYTYTTAAFRQVNANAANQVDILIGYPETTLSLQALHTFNNTNAGVSATTGIGEDSTTVLATEELNSVMLSTAAAPLPVTAILNKKPAVGRHFYPWLEFSSATGAATWYGDNGNPTIYRNGMSGWVEGR